MKIATTSGLTLASQQRLPVKELLSRIGTVRKLGTRDYLLVNRLIDQLQDRPLAEWRASIASLLANDTEQWNEIAAHVDCFTSQRSQTGVAANASVPSSKPAPTGVALGDQPRSQATLVSRLKMLATRYREKLFDLDRRKQLVAFMLVLFLSYFALSYLVPPPSPLEPTPVEDAKGANAAPAAQPQNDKPAQRVELKPLVPATTEASLPAPIETWWLIGLLSCIGATLMLLGHRLVRVARESPKLQEKLTRQALLKRDAADKKRALLEREMVCSGKRFSIEYPIEKRLPVPLNALSDCATLLGRVYRTQASQRLDARPTVQRTLAAGGRLVPVMQAARQRAPVLLFIDTERGDHPWLHGFLRIVDYWQQQGVTFEQYRFKNSPNMLVDPHTNETHKLTAVARRTDGMPLIIFSAKLDPNALNQRAAWVNAVRAWPCISWVDPVPWPLHALPAPRQNQIRELEAAGLTRFSMTAEGLGAAAQWLASEGQDTRIALPASPLSRYNPANSQHRAALDHWAAAAAMVPDPPWDLLEEIRRKFAEVHSVFKSPFDIARLLEHTRQSGVSEPYHRDGAVLNITEKVQNQWIETYRQYDEENRKPRQGRFQFEISVRQLLLKLLDEKPPHSKLERALWDFKRRMHQSFIEPWNARELLADIASSPVARSALRMIKAECQRAENNISPWGNTTVETLRREAGEASGVDWRELFWGNAQLWLPDPAMFRWIKRRLPTRRWPIAIAVLPIAMLLLSLPLMLAYFSSLLATDGLRDLWWRQGNLPAAFYLLQQSETDGPDLPDYLPDMVDIEGGTFTMGSDSGDDDERPPHEVTVGGFALSKTEVTVSQYAACVAVDGACEEPDTGANCTWPGLEQVDHEDHRNLPVNCLSWQQARDYARFARSWLVDARLPTEAEWEFAARDGLAGKAFPWGDAVPDQCVKAVTGACEFDRPQPVCSRSEGNTTSGLCDMAGNVWEWVEDDWHDNYEEAPADGVAWIDDPRGGGRVIRGGSFWLSPRLARVASRSWIEPGFRSPDVGFRLSRSLP